jgi:hypothetical protein
VGINVSGNLLTKFARLPMDIRPHQAGESSHIWRPTRQKASGALAENIGGLRKTCRCIDGLALVLSQGDEERFPSDIRMALLNFWADLNSRVPTEWAGLGER